MNYKPKGKYFNLMLKVLLNLIFTANSKHRCESEPFASGSRLLYTQIEQCPLCFAVPLLGGLAKPLDGFFVVMRGIAITGKVHSAQDILGFGITMLSRLPQPLDSLVFTLGDAVPVLVT